MGQNNKGKWTLIPIIGVPAETGLVVVCIGAFIWLAYALYGRWMSKGKAILATLATCVALPILLVGGILLDGYYVSYTDPSCIAARKANEAHDKGLLTDEDRSFADKNRKETAANDASWYEYHHNGGPPPRP